MYRCNKCGRTHTPPEAARRSYLCCNTWLRDEVASGASSTSQPAVAPAGVEARAEQGAAAFQDRPQPAANGDLQAVEVIPPAGNPVDALAMEGLLASLGLQVPFALEIAADANGRHFIIRSRPAVLEHVCAQLESVYEQVAFEPVPESADLARRLRVAGMLAQYDREDDRAVAMGRLQLRRFEALPLRTFRDGDFREGDPILAVLGAFGRVHEGERVASQLVLRPAPDDWADQFQPLTRPVDQRIKMQSPLGFAGGLLLALGVLLGGGIGLAILTYLSQGRWLGACTVGLAALPLTFAAVRVWRALMRDSAQVDPSQVARKIFLPGFEFQLRLVVESRSREESLRRLRQLAAAYRHFNAGAGNGLILEETVFDPCDLETGWNGRVRLPGSPRPIISVAEAASLWHLPWGEGAQMVPSALAPKLLPMPEDVAEGVLIGHSRHHGRSIPVHLPPSAVERNKLFVAGTRKGKTTLMLRLAQATCRLPARAETNGAEWRPGSRQAVFFIDPHGDAVKRLVGNVPLEREGDVVYVDYGNAYRVPGWNLLDAHGGLPAQLLPDTFIYAGKRIWADFWGPRMEDALRYVLYTLVRANQQLSAENQFTILDVSAAFILKNFQARLREFISDEPELLIWWHGYYDQLHMRQRLEIVNPVLTKIQRFWSSETVRRIVSQSRSTVNFRQLIADSGILLVNLPAGIIGMEDTAFVGSLLMTYLEQAIRTHQDLPPDRRPRVSGYIDECRSVPFPYHKLLAELVKMGADFTLTAQSLAQLTALDPELLDTTLANIDTLAVFRTSGRDARELVWEMGSNKVEPDDIVNLEEHHCLLKTQRDGRPLPVMHVEILDAPAADTRRAEGIVGRSYRYTTDAAEVERRYRAHVEQAYGMDLEGFQRKIAHWREVARIVEEEKEVAAGKERAEQALAELEAEYEGAGKTAPQRSLFSVGGMAGDRLPEELEARPKHTRTRKGGKGAQGEGT